MKHATRRQRWLVVAVLCLAVFMVVVDNTIVNVALPTLSRDLHASNSSLQWIVDGYSLPFAALLLTGAGLSDRLGRKRVILIGLFGFAVFSLLASSAQNIQTLLAGRALMGVSAAFIFPATLSIMTVVFDDRRERAKAFGVWGATTGVAIALGPIAGGFLITHFWYGSIFLVNVPLALVAIAAIAFVVPESIGVGHSRFDVEGLIVGTLGLTALVVAIIQGPSWGWQSLPIISLFVAAVGFITWFTVIELRTQEPLMDVRIFTNVEYAAGSGAIAINFFCLFGFIFLVTQYFQLVRGYSALSAGVHTLPFAVVVMVATPLSAIAALRIGTRYVVSAGLVITAFAMGWVATLSADAVFVGPVLASMVTLALGFSLVNAPSTAATMETLSPAQVGGGAAGNEITRELGGTLGVAVIGSVFSSVFGPAIHATFEPFRAHGLTVAAIGVAQSSMWAARLTVAHFPAPLRPSIGAQTTTAFMHGLHRASFVGAGVALATAVVVFFYLPAQRRASEPVPVIEG